MGDQGSHGGVPSDGHIVGISRGVEVTEADIERLAAEAEAGYNIGELDERTVGCTTADSVVVQLDTALRDVLQQRADKDRVSESDVIVRALRLYLDRSDTTFGLGTPT